jgi:hypothetical protein
LFIPFIKNNKKEQEHTIADDNKLHDKLNLFLNIKKMVKNSPQDPIDNSL